MRDRLTRLAAAVDELAKHGKAKPEAERGLDDVAEKSGKAISKGEHYCTDPLGNRCVGGTKRGWGLATAPQQILLRSPLRCCHPTPTPPPFSPFPRHAATETRRHPGSLP